MLSQYDGLVNDSCRILSGTIGHVRSKIIKTIHFYCKVVEQRGEKAYIDGNHYMYSSYEYFSEKHYDGLISESTIKKSIRYLERAGFIRSYWPDGCKYKSAKRYRINYEYLEVIGAEPQKAARLIPYTSKFHRETKEVFLEHEKYYSLSTDNMPKSFFNNMDDPPEDQAVYQSGDQRKSLSPKVQKSEKHNKYFQPGEEKDKEGQEQSTRLVLGTEPQGSSFPPTPFSPHKEEKQDVEAKCGVINQLSYEKLDEGGGSVSEEKKRKKQERKEAREKKRAESGSRVSSASEAGEASTEFKKNHQRAKYRLSQVRRKAEDTIAEKLKEIAEAFPTPWLADFTPTGLHGLWLEGCNQLGGFVAGAIPSKTDLAKWKVFLEACAQDGIDPRLMLVIVLKNWHQVRESCWQFKKAEQPSISDFASKDKYRILAKFYMDVVSRVYFEGDCPSKPSPFALMRYYSDKVSSELNLRDFDQSLWCDLFVDSEEYGFNGREYIDFSVKRGFTGEALFAEASIREFLAEKEKDSGSGFAID